MSTANKSKADTKTTLLSSTPNVHGEGKTSIRKDNKIDKLIDGLQARSDGLPAIQEGVSEIFSVIKGQIGNFVQSSDGLMKALDEVGKLHPFIMIAVIPFKAALTLELKRRENNKKVVALILQMSNMMATLKLLSPIKPAELGSGAESLTQRMDNRLKDAAVAIEECSHATHEYYKMKVIPKVIKSSKWEEKFTDLATKFATFQSDFAADLAFYTGAGVQATVRAVGEIDQKISMLMQFVFTRFASPEENELLSFINSQGGSDKFIKDDKLLLSLIQKHKAPQAQTSQEDDPVGQGKASFDLGNSTFDDTKKELNTDLGVLLAGSKKTFVQMFEEQKDQIAAVRDDIRRESDRIVGRLLSGAHDRVLDKYMHSIWVEMGWKGSTKTLDLVLALRDFYVHNHQYVSSLEAPQTAEVSSEPRGEADDGKEEPEKIGPEVLHAAEITPEDAWAIRVLSRSNLSPLMEAVDPDCSGHVTIKEINDFTSSRPREWSLPLWVAYWTVGFKVTLRQYCIRIRELFSLLHVVYDLLIPGNAGVFSSVLTFQSVENVIARVYAIDAGEDEYQNQSFQAYAEDVQDQLEKRLERFNYLIDDSNTLSLVTDGSSRLEESFFPLVYLLLRNCVYITAKGLNQRLQSTDFNNTVSSFYTLWNAALERVAGLQRDFKLRNISFIEEFRRYSYGMYYYVVAFEELDKDREYFIMPNPKFDPSTGDDADEEDDSTQSDSYSADDATEVNDDINSLDYVYDETNPNISESPGLVGTWSGFSYYGLSTASDIDGVTSFQIDHIDGQGIFTGGGRDSEGQFSIDGRLEGKTIMFSKKYSQPVDGKCHEYSGQINEGLDCITGKWGRIDSEPSGIFDLQKKSVEYVQFIPSGATGGKKKRRLLWKFAIEVTRRRLSTRTIRWSVLKKRRDQRRRFIALLKGSRAVGLNASDAVELKTLQSTLSIADITLYKRLALLEQDREIVHRLLCDACGKYIRMTRFICLNCSAGRYYYTVDTCSDCVNKAFTVTREKGSIKLNHLPTHLLLQIRRPLSFLLQLAAREGALSAFQKAPLDSDSEDSAGLCCDNCGISLEPPYWACCVCTDVYLCASCNTKTELSRPWLYERKQIPAMSAQVQNVDKKTIPQEETAVEHESVDSQELSVTHETHSVVSSSDSDSEASTISSTEDHSDPPLKHRWSHDLVLCTSPETVSLPVSLEGRVIGLEGKIHELQEETKFLRGGMSKLEEQLKKLEQLLQTAPVGQ